MEKKNDLIACAVFGSLMIGLIALYLATHPKSMTIDAEMPTLESFPIVEAMPEIVEKIEEVEEEAPAKEPVLSDKEIIAMVVMAEAGNQEMLGKVAVAATILNRCDMWGLTVEAVVNQPNQYSYPYYGTVSPECYRAVRIARECRDLFPENMLYFRNTRYHDFGTPYMQIGDHYFSLKEVTE